MTPRLAIDDIEISHGGNVVRLRPSLRAGLLIAQRYSIEQIQEAMAEVNFGALLYLIGLGAEDRQKAIDLIAGKTAKDGIGSLQSFVPAISEFVSVSLGLLTGDGNSQGEASFEASDLVKPLEDLFEFATGWLGWTPAEAWAATPAEILTARKGRFAMLNAIHGSGEQQTAAASAAHDIPDEAQVKSNMAALKAKLGSKL